MQLPRIVHVFTCTLPPSSAVKPGACLVCNEFSEMACFRTPTSMHLGRTCLTKSMQSTGIVVCGLCFVHRASGGSGFQQWSYMIEADVCDSSFGVLQRRAQINVHDFTPFCSMLPLRAPVGKSCSTVVVSFCPVQFRTQKPYIHRLWLL